MYLHSLAAAVPETAFTQQECWEQFRHSTACRRLKSRSVDLIGKVLLGDNGIHQRHFAVGELGMLFDLSAGELNQAFERDAPLLATAALDRALAQSKWSADSLDGLIICTCTGYLCPGITSHVAEKLGLPPDSFLQDLVGLGCGAAIPSLRAAANQVAASKSSGKPARVAVVAVEVCSAAFYLEDEPGVLISACIFADGAAAALCSSEPGPHPLRFSGFDTVHQPENRELLRFVNSDGKLKNRLHRSVPQRAGEAVQILWDRAAQARDPRQKTAPRMVAHSGGRDVLNALAHRFPEQDLSSAREVLHDYGNMSSPSVLFALERELQRQPQPAANDLWLVSFGAGFCAHSCRLSTD